MHFIKIIIYHVFRGSALSLRVERKILSPLVYSFIVFNTCEFNPMERKIHFRENWLIFWGILGEAELILRIWGAKENTFRELRIFFHGFREINALFSGIKGALTPPPWGLTVLKGDVIK